MTAEVFYNTNIVGFWFMLTFIIMMIIFPQRYIFVPIIAMTCYMTIGQQVVIYGLHFPVLRIMVFFGWIRLFIRSEISAIKLNSIDKIIILWVIISVINYTFVHNSEQALINRLGFAYTALGLYFMFRFLIKNLSDIDTIITLFAILIVPLACLMLYENLTQINIFSVFGGVGATEVRDITNRFRSTGPFNHPILAGTFGATLFPLIVSLWFKKTNKIVPIVGIIAATLITISTASSGPIIAYISGLIGFCMWPLRKHMSAVRWGLLCAVIALHLIMKAPVWYLTERIGSIMGGSGWYRAYLIDKAINHIGEWWLIGTAVTAHWMPFAFGDRADLTNQFIVEGVNGGMIKLILFIMIIVSCFKNLGRSIKAVDSQSIGIRMTIWSLGVALLTHIVSFLSVSYFDQTIMSLYLLLAMISSINADSLGAEISYHGK